jgi:hypothetical protein
VLIKCSNKFKALIRAAKSEEYEDIREALCGIVFLGTPHQGSSASSIGSFLAWLTARFFGSNMMLLKSLQWHASELSNLHQAFLESFPKGTLVFSFYETLPTLVSSISIGLVSFHYF